MSHQINIGNKQVIISPIKPLHQDQRGWIVAADGSEENINEISSGLQPRLLSTKPQVIRGNHWHDEETETIIILNNRWQAVFADEAGNERQEIELDCSKSPMKVVVPPKVAHALINLSKSIGYIFHYSNKPFTIQRSNKIELLSN
jgi:dTDP-4-dehydrorhamnose 3,5-epimerase-like enzyme